MKIQTKIPKLQMEGHLHKNMNENVFMSFMVRNMLQLYTTYFLNGF